MKKKATEAKTTTEPSTSPDEDNRLKKTKLISSSLQESGKNGSI
nr:hypothetical protein [Mastigocoleus testarum]